jgi:hypothetical protein
MAPRPRLAELARFRSWLVLLTAARSGPAWFRRSPVRSAWLARSRVASAWFRRSPVRSAWLARSRVASAWFRRAGIPAAGRQRTWPGPPLLPAADRTPARTTPAGLRAALITARPGTRPVRLERRAVVRLVRLRLVRLRPVRAGLVRAGLVEPGIGLGEAAVAARLAPVLPEGSGGRTRRRRPGIPALGPAIVGASGRPTIRPGHAAVRRARIDVVPLWLLGHLDSDVSRCRSTTRAAGWSSRHGCCARPGGEPVARAHPRASARGVARTTAYMLTCVFVRNNPGCQRFSYLAVRDVSDIGPRTAGCRGSFHRQIEHFADGAGEPPGLDRQRAAGEHPVSGPGVAAHSGVGVEEAGGLDHGAPVRHGHQAGIDEVQAVEVAGDLLA